MLRICVALIFIFTLHFHPSFAHVQRDHLNIRPIAQQTIVWCWAAVSEMVLRHYRFPVINPGGDYQCGIVAMLAPQCQMNCYSCVTSIGSTSDMALVIEKYQMVSDAYLRGHRGRNFSTQLAGALSPEEIVYEIDEDNPIVAGISPSGMGPYYLPGMSEHAVLIVGYYQRGSSFHVLVNDPMPYPSFGFNPYLAVGGQQSTPGQYWIDYRVFVSRLLYKNSILFFR